MIFLIWGIAILFSSCKKDSIVQKNPESTTWEARLNDMLPKPMIRAIMTDSLEATIPFGITENKKKKLSNVSFNLLKNEGTIHLKTNNSGLVFLNLNHDLLSENPTIRIITDSTLSRDIRYAVGGKTVVFREGKSVNNEILEFENLPFIVDGEFKLYYTTSKDSAIQQLPIFLKSIARIMEIMGKNEIQFINPLLVMENNVSIIGEPDSIIILPVNIESWEETYWYFVHETVENDLISPKNIYSKNPNSRFIGDGLAELVSFMILKSVNPDLAEIMMNNRRKSIETSSQMEFDVYNWSIAREEIEGYSYSLAFWLQLLNNHSLEQIQSFIKTFEHSNGYAEKDIYSIFEKAFEQEVTLKLTKEEAMNTLTFSDYQ